MHVLLIVPMICMLFMHAAKAQEECYFVEEGTEVIGGEGKEKLLSELSVLNMQY